MVLDVTNTMSLHLWYEAEDEFPRVIEEEVPEEVLPHRVLSGGRKLVLHSLQAILAAVLLHLLPLPLSVCHTRP